MRNFWIPIYALCICSQAIAQDVRRELRPWFDGRWAVVEVREISGSLVIAHPTVGRVIDFEEYNRFGVFQGVTEFNKRWFFPALTQPVSGFQSARFLKLANGDYGIDVTFRSEMGVRHRWIEMWDRAELMRICEFFGAHSDTAVSDVEETEEQVVFEVVKPQYSPTRRVKGELWLAEGERLYGELLPTMETRQIMLETPRGFRRIDVTAVEQMRIGGSGGMTLVRKTVRGGTKWGLIGGLTGLMAGLAYEGTSAKEEMIYGALLAGAVGASFGFVDGLFSLRLARTFRLNTPKGQPAREIEWMPTRVRLRF